MRALYALAVPTLPWGLEGALATVVGCQALLRIWVSVSSFALHLGVQGGQLGLMSALALFGKGLQGLSLVLVGLLAEGVALFHDAGVELELLLTIVLPALEPAAEDLQEGGAGRRPPLGPGLTIG